MFKMIREEMTAEEIRRRQLAKLVKERFDGVYRKLAAAVDKDPQQVNSWFTDNEKSRRNIGPRLARQIEERLGLETGWLDRLDDGDKFDLAAQQLEAHFNQLTVRKIINWSDIEAHLAGEPVKQLGAFAMPASAGTGAFFVACPSDVISGLASKGDLIAIDPQADIQTGDYVLTRSKGVLNLFIYQGKHGDQDLFVTDDPRIPSLSSSEMTILGKIIFAGRGLHI